MSNRHKFSKAYMSEGHEEKLSWVQISESFESQARYCGFYHIHREENYLNEIAERRN